MAISDKKKRYSMALTPETIERLQKQFAEMDVLSPHKVSGLIARMVDDVLYQMSEHVMPAVIEAAKKKSKVTEVDFMLMVLHALRDVGKREV